MNLNPAIVIIAGMLLVSCVQQETSIQWLSLHHGGGTSSSFSKSKAYQLMGKSWDGPLESLDSSDLRYLESLPGFDPQNCVFADNIFITFVAGGRTHEKFVVWSPRNEGLDRIARKLGKPSPPPVGAISSPDGKVSVRLRSGGNERLCYRVSFQGGEAVEFPSSYAKNERPKMHLNKRDDGIFVGVREDSQALVIEERVGAAVADADPIYLRLENRKFKVQAYTPADFKEAPAEGRGSRIAFFGWKRNGDPDLRRVLED